MSGQPPKSPDQELAAVITQALVEAQIIDESKAAKLEERIATGTMQATEWQAIFEFQRPVKNPGVDHG